MKGVEREFEVELEREKVNNRRGETGLGNFGVISSLLGDRVCVNE